MDYVKAEEAKKVTEITLEAEVNIKSASQKTSKPAKTTKTARKKKSAKVEPKKTAKKVSVKKA